MLLQNEADSLINMEKKKSGNERYSFPSNGQILTLPLKSVDNKEDFLLDVNRKGTIKLSKCTYINRYRINIRLLRLDMDGPEHTNPNVEKAPLPYLAEYNGKEIPCPHLHVFVEGFNDRWAIPAPPELVADFPDLNKLLDAFFTKCNVIEPPIFERGLSFGTD